jgi:hypothetical protein
MPSTRREFQIDLKFFILVGMLYCDYFIIIIIIIIIIISVR